MFLVRSGGVAVPESFSVDYGTTEVVPFPRIVTREIALAVLARTLSHETRKEAWLSQIASHDGTDTERLVKDAVLLLLERDARFRAAVRKRKVPPLRFASVGMTEL